jgi:hypothetical protein
MALPDRIGNFWKGQVEHYQPLSGSCGLHDQLLGFGGIGFRKNPLGDDAAIQNQIAQRLRSAAISAALSGKTP